VLFYVGGYNSVTSGTGGADLELQNMLLTNTIMVFVGSMVRLLEIVTEPRPGFLHQSRIFSTGKWIISPTLISSRALRFSRGDAVRFVAEPVQVTGNHSSHFLSPTLAPTPESVGAASRAAPSLGPVKAPLTVDRIEISSGDRIRSRQALREILEVLLGYLARIPTTVFTTHYA